MVKEVKGYRRLETDTRKGGGCGLVFSSHSRLVFGNPALHAKLLNEICDYMALHRYIFATLLGLSLQQFDLYLVEMRRQRQRDAAAKMTGRQIEVFSECNNTSTLPSTSPTLYFRSCVPVDLTQFPGCLNFRQPFSPKFLFAAPLPPYPDEAVYLRDTAMEAGEETALVKTTAEALPMKAIANGGKAAAPAAANTAAARAGVTVAAVTEPSIKKQKRKHSPSVGTAAASDPSADGTATPDASAGAATSNRGAEEEEDDGKGEGFGSGERG